MSLDNRVLKCLNAAVESENSIASVKYEDPNLHELGITSLNQVTFIVNLEDEFEVEFEYEGKES